MPAGAGEAPVGAAARMARQSGALFADRRILRASRRLALVRTQRGKRAALPVSRLEIRPYRPMHRSAFRARRKRLLQEDQAEILSAGRAWRISLDLYGPGGQTAALAGIRGRAGAA